MLLLCFIYLSSQITGSTAFTLTSEDLEKGIPLPHQRPSFFYPNTLTRINEDGSIRDLVCPFPSYLDREKAICKFPKLTKEATSPFVPPLFPDEFIGLVPCKGYQRNTQITYPPSCREYINCNCCGVGFVMACPRYTLFNNRTKQCVLPLEADCCEFPAKNSGSVVVSNFV